MNSKENNRQGKNRTKILKKLGVLLHISIALALISSLIFFYIAPHLQHSVPPSVTSYPSSNPVINTRTTQTITMTVNAAIKPAYSNDFVETTRNPNDPYECYMVIEFRGIGWIQISTTKGQSAY